MNHRAYVSNMINFISCTIITFIRWSYRYNYIFRMRLNRAAFSWLAQNIQLDFEKSYPLRSVNIHSPHLQHTGVVWKKKNRIVRHDRTDS